LQRCTGTYRFDYEAWCFDRATFESFFERLVQYGQAIILSGDVHYSFSAGMSYWDARAGTGAAERRARFVQLCASSFKNSIDVTMTIGDNYVPLSWMALWSHSWLGWNQPGTYIREINSKRVLAEAVLGAISLVPTWPPPPWPLRYGQLATIVNVLVGYPLRVKGRPAMHRLIAGDRIIDTQPPPEWRYRINFIEDQRTERGIPPTPVSTTTAVLRARNHGVFPRQANRTVVGRDNMGKVTFRWNPGGEQEVIHTLYYNLPEVGDRFGPFTQHVIPCNIPSIDDPNDPRPGD
jgi:hypothetical protein